VVDGLVAGALVVGAVTVLTQLVPPARAVSVSPSYVSCGGTRVHLERLSANGREEAAPGDPQDALRHFLHSDRRIASTRGGHWVLLAKTLPNRDFINQPGVLVTFGRRVGAFGVASVVVVEQRPRSWALYASGDGCEGTVHPAKGLETQQIQGFSVNGRMVSLDWDGDRCGNDDHVPGQVLVRIEVRHRPDGVHLRIVTQRDPFLGPYQQVACLFAGRKQLTHGRVYLDQALDGQRLWDDSRLPSIAL
jgi:hypothetical protein